VRFETGRRIPNTPASGVAWADGRIGATRVAPLVALGAVVTLVGGALGLITNGAGTRPSVRPHRSLAVLDPSARPHRSLAAVVAAPMVVLPFVLGAAAWGLYGIALAPELAVVPLALAPLVEVTARLDPAEWRAPFAVVVVGGVIALFLGLALAWRLRL